MDRRRLTESLLNTGRISRRAALRRLGGASAVAAGGLWPAHGGEPRLREFALTAAEFAWPLMDGTVGRLGLQRPGAGARIPRARGRPRTGHAVQRAPPYVCKHHFLQGMTGTVTVT